MKFVCPCLSHNVGSLLPSQLVNCIKIGQLFALPSSPNVNLLSGRGLKPILANGFCGTWRNCWFIRKKEN